MPRKKQVAKPLPDKDTVPLGNAPSPDPAVPVLTPAEKRKATIAAKKKSESAKAVPKSKPPAQMESIKDTPIARVIDNPVEIAVEKITPPPVWEHVSCMSDNLLTVQAVNIAPFGKKSVMMRFIVDGKLHGSVVVLPDIQYRAGTDKFT